MWKTVKSVAGHPMVQAVAAAVLVIVAEYVAPRKRTKKQR